jgi:hypothetical protein
MIIAVCLGASLVWAFWEMEQIRERWNQRRQREAFRQRHQAEAGPMKNPPA